MSKRKTQKVDKTGASQRDLSRARRESAKVAKKVASSKLEELPKGGTFVFELDDLILGTLVPIEELENLDRKKLEAIRVSVERTLRSDKVIGILREKFSDIRPGLGRVPDLFPPDVFDTGTSYFEGALGPTLVSEIFPATEVVSLTQTEFRLISSILKKEILTSEVIHELLVDATKEAIQ